MLREKLLDDDFLSVADDDLSVTGCGDLTAREVEEVIGGGDGLGGILGRSVYTLWNEHVFLLCFCLSDSWYSRFFKDGIGHTHGIRNESL